MQTAQPDMNMDQDRQMLMVEDNVGNQFRPNAECQESGIANQYQIRNVVTARAEGNGNGINGNQTRCYNCQGVDHYANNCTVKAKEMGCCSSSETDADCLKGRSRDSTHF
ncbi:reverse transcriptase domain-containing protein [Tanacetum coccineum]